MSTTPHHRAKPPSDMRPRTRRTRGRIMEGAKQAVTQLGMRATTVQDILNRAEVSRRTFYQYFEGIDAVLDALYEDLTENLLQSVNKALDETEDPAEKIGAGITAYLDVQQAGGLLIALLQAEAVRPDSVLAPRRDNTLERMVETLDRAIVAALDVRVDPYVYRALLIGIEGLIIHVERTGSFPPSERIRVEAVMRGMIYAVLGNTNLLPALPDDPDKNP